MGVSRVKTALQEPALFEAQAQQTEDWRLSKKFDEEGVEHHREPSDCDGQKGAMPLLVHVVWVVEYNQALD